MGHKAISSRQLERKENDPCHFSYIYMQKAKVHNPTHSPLFMDTRFKFEISRLVRASFSSCKSKRLSNDIQDPVFIHHHFQHLEPSSPFARPYSFLHPQPDATDGRRRAASPDSALKSHVKLKELEHVKEENPAKMMRRKTKTDRKKKKMEGIVKMLSSSSSAESRELFSSDGEREEETETLFSSKSFSSDSLEFYCSHCSSRSRRTAKCHRRRIHARNSNVGFETLDSVSPNAVLGGKLRDSVAVVKRTNDPYGDFRRSMMEMIIEKQMFTVKDLQQLLQCFLSLNSVHHYQVIVEAFTEIWDALFVNWP